MNIAMYSPPTCDTQSTTEESSQPLSRTQMEASAYTPRSHHSRTTNEQRGRPSISDLQKQGVFVGIPSRSSQSVGNSPSLDDMRVQLRSLARTWSDRQNGDRSSGRYIFEEVANRFPVCRVRPTEISPEVRRSFTYTFVRPL